MNSLLLNPQTYPPLKTLPLFQQSLTIKSPFKPNLEKENPHEEERFFRALLEPIDSFNTIGCGEKETPSYSSLPSEVSPQKFNFCLLLHLQYRWRV